MDSSGHPHEFSFSPPTRGVFPTLGGCLTQPLWQRDLEAAFPADKKCGASVVNAGLGCCLTESWRISDVCIFKGLGSHVEVWYIPYVSISATIRRSYDELANPCWLSLCLLFVCGWRGTRDLWLLFICFAGYPPVLEK